MFKTTLMQLALAGLAVSSGASADEAAIRKNLPERLPNFPKIDEVLKTPIPGVYEVRMGNELLYSDETGSHLIDGHIIDTRSRSNLTEARLAVINRIDFASLPLKDAVVFKLGTGARKLAIFADPNCGYCKQFERSLSNLKDVTVYTFLYPILGGDSPDKSRAIWCSKDVTNVWRAWMLDGQPPPRTMGACDSSAIERNIAFAQKHRVTATPALVFESGERVQGAIPLDQVEKRLLAVRDPAR